MRDKIIVVIRTGENILNHGVKVMLGVTANNDNGDDSNNEIRKSNKKKVAKGESNPAPLFLMITSFQKLSRLIGIKCGHIFNLTHYYNCFTTHNTNNLVKLCKSHIEDSLMSKRSD